MTTYAFEIQADISSDPLQRYHACKAMARGYAESKKAEEDRLAHARALCAVVVESYWDALCEQHCATLKIRPAPIALPSIPADAHRMGVSTGRLVASFPVEDAGYLIGSIYTVMLPPSMRSEMGAYYTPPPLVSRLLDLAEAAGFDFKTGSVIDPACGGGAFLAPVALRMIAHSENASPDWTIRRLAKRLRGVELDPFAAWVSRVLLEAAVMPICIKAKRRLPDVVTVADALQPHDFGTFDLVVGNPPYGRITLDEPMRQLYSRSLFGHANLYGLFTDLALRLVKPAGVIAYLTPTSFLGGQYFKALRALLLTETTPKAIDFVSDRNGVFDNVLQETMLTTYAKNKSDSFAKVSALIPQGLNAARVEPIGNVAISNGSGPWLLPREKADSEFLITISTMPTRLIDLGYTVSTGPLVWNRHRSQLRDEKTADSLPLIWAESVVTDGFMFSAERRNHVPYIAPRKDQPHLVTRHSCVLVQRTTSKEQNRRLLAALLPQSFLDNHGGAVIENHLNMVQAPSMALASISPETIAALLNSSAADRAFRCISGSVAVSAYELNALPLPTPKQLKMIEHLVHSAAPKLVVERAIASCYGVS